MQKMSIAKNWKVIETSNIEEVLLLSNSVGLGGLVDDRHDIYSTHNTMDIEGYFNYIDSIRQVAQTRNVGKFHYMLEIGYMPVVMPPMPYGGMIHDMVIPVLDARKIPYIPLVASSFSKPQYSNINPDIWVSKMDVYNIIKCRPEDVTVKKLLEVIL